MISSSTGEIPTTARTNPLVRWWFTPVARARLAILRHVVYPFVFVDVLVTTSWIRQHADTPTSLYQPLLIGRLLPLPVPTTTVVEATLVLLLVSTGVAATGRWPRVAGWTTFALYLQWMVIGFSYGKVDHDRFGFLLALAMLSIPPRLSMRDHTPDEGVGWAIRNIQVAVVATYFLAAWAKLRYGGWAWVNSATLVRAVVRRGTALGDVLADHAWTLRWSQWGILACELLSPILLFLRGRALTIAVGVAFGFHLAVFATVRIVFLPHLVCLLAFLPLERLTQGRSGDGPAGRVPEGAAPARSHG